MNEELNEIGLKCNTLCKQIKNYILSIPNWKYEFFDEYFDNFETAKFEFEVENILVKDGKIIPYLNIKITEDNVDEPIIIYKPFDLYDSSKRDEYYQHKDNLKKYYLEKKYNKQIKEHENTIKYWKELINNL